MPRVAGRTLAGGQPLVSDPWREDSDLDGACDDEEACWDQNYDNYEEDSDLYHDLGIDQVPNVRDPDSDNDGILDGAEVNWSQDETGQGLDTDTLANMIDIDSDGDGLWDSEESSTTDTDGDGWVNAVDPDSDNDGLPDGWADQYVWDPQYGDAGYFIDYYTFITTHSGFPAQTNGSFDAWEGEYKDRYNVLHSGETDPCNRDSDADGLWDGYDYYISESGWEYGELYYSGYQNRVYNGSQQYASTNARDVDSDCDGVRDGMEVLGWNKNIFVRSAHGDFTLNSTILKSDPSNRDTDGDTLRDGLEYNFDTSPVDWDTDDDNLSDQKEWNYSSKLAGNDFDSDNDFLPDGYVENWWRDNITRIWLINSSNPDGNTVANYWEGEDIDLDGVKDAYESNPVKPDTDGDSIIDGIEYFFDNIYYVMDPSKQVTGTSNYNCDYDGTEGPNAVDQDSDNDSVKDSYEDGDHDGELDGTKGTNGYPFYASAKEPNPYDDDTDGDGLKDGSDLIIGGMKRYGADLDNDGLVCAVDTDSDGDTQPDNTDDDPSKPFVSGDTNGNGDADDDDDGRYDSQEDTNHNGVYDAQYDNSSLNASDTDLDGLNDTQEAYNDTNPEDADSDNDGIEDGDEVNQTYYELLPNNPDSDGDGVYDGFVDDGDGEYEEGEEWGEKGDWVSSLGTQAGNGGLNSYPDRNDSDSDGLKDNNSFEVDIDSSGKIVGNLNSDNSGNNNVKDNDSDNDNLLDGLEDHDDDGIQDSDESSPVDLDTDNDGLPDGWIDGWGYEEGSPAYNDQTIEGWGDYNTTNDIAEEIEGEDLDCDGIKNINETTTLISDRDNDGLKDGEEAFYHSDPDIPDTDSDGLLDGFEVHCWNVTLNGVYTFHVSCSPIETDTDDDGLSDYQEYLGKDGFEPGKAGDSNDATNPGNPDTDGDGLLDYWEVYNKKPNAPPENNYLGLEGANPCWIDMFIEVDEMNKKEMNYWGPFDGWVSEHLESFAHGGATGMGMNKESKYPNEEAYIEISDWFSEGYGINCHITVEKDINYEFKTDQESLDDMKNDYFSHKDQGTYRWVCFGYQWDSFSLLSTGESFIVWQSGFTGICQTHGKYDGKNDIFLADMSIEDRVTEENTLLGATVLDLDEELWDYCTGDQYMFLYYMGLSLGMDTRSFPVVMPPATPVVPGYRNPMYGQIMGYRHSYYGVQDIDSISYNKNGGSFNEDIGKYSEWPGTFKQFGDGDHCDDEQLNLLAQCVRYPLVRERGYWLPPFIYV